MYRHFITFYVATSFISMSFAARGWIISKRNVLRVPASAAFQSFPRYPSKSIFTPIVSTTRLFSGVTKKDIAETPLFKDAPHLLNGLDTYSIQAEDGHPLSIYGIQSNVTELECNRKPILLLHGRTWSAVPVYHLLGGKNASEKQHSRSLMESMYENGMQPYAMDFRGFGGTPSDETDQVIPSRCVADVECALKWIIDRHNLDGNHLPALLGWSQGALVAQLFVQTRAQLVSKLILYGSIYDPLVRYPRVPLFVNGENVDHPVRMKNTFNAAIEDFTVEGSIPPDAAIEFAEAALKSDPYKAQWKYLCQFNNLDPARVHVPTLVVAGDKDPYAPLRVQADLFTNLGRGADRTWSIIADADHAVHMLDSGKDRFLSIVKSFIENSKRGQSVP